MKIGILGATGAVGRQMIQCLEEQKIETEELRLFASPRSAGKAMQFKNQELHVEPVSAERLADLDIVLGAVSAELAREYAPLIVKPSAVFIDNSKAFRLDPNVPLVIPEINGSDAKQHHGIIANPNCSTIITLMAAAPIARISPIRNLIASTYQAVSGAGINGLQELTEQTKAVLSASPVNPSVFPAQIAFNCIPWIGSEDEDGYTSEEKKMQDEGRKIMHMPNMNVTCTCVRVPVYRSHSISFSMQCEQKITVEQAKEAIRGFAGVHLVEDGYPMPIDTSNQNDVYVGRIRPDHVFEGGLTMFCCGDQIRKGAAANAVQIISCL